jgi:hypothetical protein
LLASGKEASAVREVVRKFLANLMNLNDEPSESFAISN